MDVKQIFYSIGSNGRYKEGQSEAAPWFEGTLGCGCDGHGSSFGNQATRSRVGIPEPTERSWLNAVAGTQGEESPHAENQVNVKARGQRRAQVDASLLIHLHERESALDRLSSKQ
ncbi:hypothetical protein L7F22_066524 [Adiantum nelumboides]|nr:hypothetical protein [Adiantum nelumboides]